MMATNLFTNKQMAVSFIIQVIMSITGLIRHYGEHMHGSIEVEQFIGLYQHIILQIILFCFLIVTLKITIDRAVEKIRDQANNLD